MLVPKVEIKEGFWEDHLEETEKSTELIMTTYNVPERKRKRIFDLLVDERFVDIMQVIDGLNTTTNKETA